MQKAHYTCYEIAAMKRRVCASGSAVMQVGDDGQAASPRRRRHLPARIPGDAADGDDRLASPGRRSGRDSARARRSRCPWSWFRRSVRRRCRWQRPAALRRPAPGHASIDRRSRRRRRRCAPRRPDRSSWPTWTPAAPLSARDVGAVVDDEQRAVRRSATEPSGRRAPGSHGSIRVLHRSCRTRAPPAR